MACADDTNDAGGNDEIGNESSDTIGNEDTTESTTNGEEQGETMGETTMGETTMGEETMGEETMGETTMGETTMGEETMGEETMGETQGEETMGEETMGETQGEETMGETMGEEDTTTSTTGQNNGCEAPAQYVDCDDFQTNDAFEAIGVNCGADPTSTVVANNVTMNSNNTNAWRVATGFGSAPGDNFGNLLWAANDDAWQPPDDGDPNTPLPDPIPANTSSTILILSTGVVAQPNGQGVVVEQNGSQGGNGDNQNEDNGGLPAPLSAQYGSNMGAGGTPFMDCDLVNDCSDSLYNHWVVNGWNNPNDKLWMTMNLTVPVGTEGYIFDFAYFSSEFPSWYNTQYNDLFIAWSTSESYTGNITFVNDAPLTITSLEDAGAFQYKDNAPELAGTGFEGNAGTGWFVARGSAVPEETFELTFFIADMADSVLATGVLLDNFRWECTGCIPSEVNSCGIQPQ
ncbi:hypothetical protein PPSIR1_37394 [Plesiocystis pacifica SIR-1]|uniref:Uncharacterized protein n=1 Tax=Plesiocystis pacifica SIR-1 TaxID=391625 RepID=A6GJT3_9BACT|nr:choice-of-anchor L domain-containing protein [Plesiocystis pacifica]EDM73865.1 hypothetical protein PPSIR1_37394 [Plesiocystis pacifica SIR-1]